ncbi:unnamed protein product [Orchesella dallaii]|uniref:Uncharacterized protein n=1 Tax=Orchesella dallaii TaxID=48710 RepID=A0ABP1RGK2_9HEXA
MLHFASYWGLEKRSVHRPDREKIGRMIGTSTVCAGFPTFFSRIVFPSAIWGRVPCSLQLFAIHRCYWSSKGIYGNGWKAYQCPHEHTGTLAGTTESVGDGPRKQELEIDESRGRNLN